MTAAQRTTTPGPRTEPLFNVEPKLTERQQWVYHEMRTGQKARPLEVGAMLHRWQGCNHCTPDEPCQYAENAGRQVLEALRKKGLLKRDRHHLYRRTDTPGHDPSTAPFPAGF